MAQPQSGLGFRSRGWRWFYPPTLQKSEIGKADAPRRGYSRPPDGDHNIFLRPSETPGLTVQRTGMTEAAQGRTASVSPIYFWYLKRPSNVGTITSTEAPLRLRLTTVVISSKRCRSSPRPSNSSLRLPISSRQDGGSSPGCKEGQARLIRLGPTVLITDIICKR